MRRSAGHLPRLERQPGRIFLRADGRALLRRCVTRISIGPHRPSLRRRRGVGAKQSPAQVQPQLLRVANFLQRCKDRIGHRATRLELRCIDWRDKGTADATLVAAIAMLVAAWTRLRSRAAVEGRLPGEIDA